MSNEKCIVARQIIEEMIESHMPEVMAALADECDALTSDMGFVFGSEDAFIASLETVSESIRKALEIGRRAEQ